MSNKERAVEILAQLATGTLDKALFTPDACWWGNTGQTFPLDDFLELLAVLHAATVNGIKIDTGLVIQEGDIVIVEATSHIPLTNGGLYSNRYLFLFRFEDARVREVKEYNDTAHLKECFAFLGGE